MTLEDYIAEDTKRLLDPLVFLVLLPFYALTGYMVTAYCPAWFAVTLFLLVLILWLFYTLIVYNWYCRKFDHRWIYSPEKVEEMSRAFEGTALGGGKRINHCGRFWCQHTTYNYGVTLTSEKEKELILSIFKKRLEEK